jgi:hypothetical protein
MAQPLSVHLVETFDTGYMRTYIVLMNVTLSIDEQLVARARKKAKVLGKSLNELIRDYLQKFTGGDDPEQSIEEFKRLSGRGHSRGWRFSRDQAHDRRLSKRRQAQSSGPRPLGEFSSVALVYL